MSDRTQVEEQAALWLLRQDEPEWSEGDQRSLDAWLDASMGHKAAYWRLEHGWRQADRLAAHRPAAALPRSRWVPQRTWKAAAIAASVLAAVAVTGWTMIADAPRKTYMTELGGHETVPLPDGTHMELNTNTKLRSEVTQTGRVVWLDRGEAYFEVAHDPSRPFVIYAGPRKITVLGTKFSIRRDNKDVQVSVVEGKVRVDALESPKPVAPAVLTPGQVAIARGTETLLAPKSVERVESDLSWRRGVLTFDQFTVARAAEEFNRYNRRKIIVTDPLAGAIRIGGTFQSDNIDGFVELLEEGYGLRIEAGPDQVKISG